MDGMNCRCKNWRFNRLCTKHMIKCKQFVEWGHTMLKNKQNNMKVLKYLESLCAILLSATRVNCILISFHFNCLHGWENLEYLIYVTCRLVGSCSESDGEGEHCRKISISVRNCCYGYLEFGLFSSSKQVECYTWWRSTEYSSIFLLTCLLWAF